MNFSILTATLFPLSLTINIVLVLGSQEERVFSQEDPGTSGEHHVLKYSKFKFFSVIACKKDIVSITTNNRNVEKITDFTSLGAD